MLGNLAKKLRVLGYDSKYFSSIEDDKLIAIAKNEKRIILTKDAQLTKIAEKQNVVFVDAYSYHIDLDLLYFCPGTIFVNSYQKVYELCPDGHPQKEHFFCLTSGRSL